MPRTKKTYKFWDELGIPQETTADVGSADHTRIQLGGEIAENRIDRGSPARMAKMQREFLERQRLEGEGK